MQKIKVEQHTFTAGTWFAAWLFTIGFMDLSFFEGLVALVIWPYYLGTAIAGMI